MGPGRKIAIFDLDGTLVKGSSFNRFVKYLVITLITHFGEYRISMKAAKIFMEQCVGRKSHREAKFEIMEIADCFFSKLYYVLFTSELGANVNEKVKKRLNKLRMRGYYTVLLSASPEQYVQYVGKYYGFKHVAGTPMSLSVNDYAEMRGACKASVIKELVQNGDSVEYIFTDHTDDYKIISLCRGAKAVLVNPSKTLVEMCEADGVNYEVIQ